MRKQGLIESPHGIDNYPRSLSGYQANNEACAHRLVTAITHLR